MKGDGGGRSPLPVVLAAGLLVVASGVILHPRLQGQGEGPHPPMGADALAGPLPVVAPGDRMGGVSFVAPRNPVGPEALDPLERVGVGWIAVIPYAFLREGGEVVYDPERQWWGETPGGVAETVAMAHARGLQVFLKPHLWVPGVGWPGEYLPEDEGEWARFRDSYGEYLLRFARMADSLGVELLAVGTEVDRVALERPDLWRDLIRDVRREYAGRLTYAANWDAYGEVEFWDALDLIGVDAYFPLSSASTPEVSSLERAWKPHRTALERLARRHGRPILFAEYGYRSIDGAAGRQWELPPEGRRGADRARSNPEAQVNAYEALLRTFWEEPWFAGGFLWKWFADDETRRPGGDADYTPQHKPVEGVIRGYYDQVRQAGGG